MSVIRAVLFDMDGVLASVGTSYREAIVKTAGHFGVTITHEDITAEKKRGNANNDWILSKRLIESKNDGSVVNLEEVTNVFEDFYQGTATMKGLCETETLITPKGFLEEIRRRCSGNVAVVTGRPRKDCDKFLQTHGLKDIFPVCVCMEDAPAKPNPRPVQIAAEKLGINPDNCIMIGDTPDDVRAAVAAGCVAWGVLTPEEDAKITLGYSSPAEGMSASIMAAGAVGIMKAGIILFQLALAHNGRNFMH